MDRTRTAAPLTLSRAQLRDDGFSDTEIAGAMRSGDLIRVARGAYVCGDADDGLTPSERYRAHVIARMRLSRAVLASHISALAVHAIPIDGADLARLHVTRAGRGGSVWTPGYTRHVGMLREEDKTEVGGIPVTSVARTLIDVARTEGVRTTVVAADFALQHGMATAAAVRDAADASTHLPGIGAARRALSRADGRSESVGESRLRLRFAEGGLPPPELQIDVIAPGGKVIGRCDAGYPERGVLIEFDGLDKYVHPYRRSDDAAAVVIREKRREDALRAAGFVVVRFTWADLQVLETVHKRISSALEQGDRMVGAGNVGRWRAREPVRIDV